MPLLLNLRHLQRNSLLLQGQLPLAELDLSRPDEMIHLREALQYDLEAQQIGANILLQGSLELVLDCECVRCLKPFRLPVRLGQWVCHLPLEGEGKIESVND